MMRTDRRLKKAKKRSVFQVQKAVIWDARVKAVFKLKQVTYVRCNPRSLPPATAPIAEVGRGWDDVRIYVYDYRGTDDHRLTISRGARAGQMMQARAREAG